MYNKSEDISYSCIFKKIEDNNLIVQMQDINYYSFTVKDDTAIRDNKGKNITEADLKVGDTINVVSWFPDLIYTIGVAYDGHSVENINDVKKIKVLDQDLAQAKAIENKDKTISKKAIVVKVNEDSIGVMGTKNEDDLITVKYSKEGNIGYKQGQEVLIYFTGAITPTNPKTIENVGEIKIINENSNVQIPKKVLETFYNSFNNVDINVDEINSTGISFTIKDVNDLPYTYSNTYKILRKDIKTISSENSKVQGFSSIGAVNVSWEDVPKINNINSEDTGTFENIDENTIRKTYDWSNLYGELKNGEYQFLLQDENTILVRISFSINENGDVSDVETGFFQDYTVYKY